MKIKILIIGATGMLGNALFGQLSKKRNFEAWGTVRNFNPSLFSENLNKKIITNIDIENIDSLVKVFGEIKPDVVLNCVGLIKQVMGSKETALAIYMNSYFPHRLSLLCAASGARMIHFSTDCVFSGKKGMYKETDPSDAEDIYGKTKFLGEVLDDNCVTIRTSIIGHGLESHVSLIDWFLAQDKPIRGFTKVIYSGLPTVEIARIVADYVIPNKRLKGLYHVSAGPISKYDLLKLVAKTYGKRIDIKPFDDIISDRSLDSTKFKRLASYLPPSWPSLIKKMFKYYKSSDKFTKF